MILAGDIGGTNTRLAAFLSKRGRLVMRGRADFVNAGAGSFEEIARRFIDSIAGQFTVACFGVAGPVRNGRAVLTNLNWRLDEQHLARSLGVRRVELINDLVAHAHGIGRLRPRDLVQVQRGEPIEGGNRAIIAPGTGLGEAGLIFDEKSGGYLSFASEGGHCDFAPFDDRSDALMHFVRKRLRRCSWEDVLSGPGLKNVYDFIARGRGDAGITPPQITEAASNGFSRACVETVELFANILAAEAGNLALKVLASGGVYIGGGIAPHIVTFLRAPAVRKTFANKGPRNIKQLLTRIPIRVITSKETALFGAAQYALRV